MYAFLHKLCVFYIYVLSGEARIVSREDYGKILAHMASRELKEPHGVTSWTLWMAQFPLKGGKLIYKAEM